MELAPFKKILLVDDDEDDQDIFSLALKTVSPGAAFFSEIDARQALDRLTAGDIVPDVIFLDLNIPLMGGVQFLEQVKQHERIKNIPVIIYSTSSLDATIKTTRTLGAAEFITKPDTFDDLVKILSKYIRTHDDNR